jgi:aspartyl-tRNA synthetase
MMAKQSRFKKAALLARETAATKEEGETQAMLFAMLQEQHEKQMATMAASNKANMVAMMERMNALVTAGGGRLGWEIHSEFRGILQFFQFWTFWILEFSLEFYFSDCKMCSRQF